MGFCQVPLFRKRQFAAEIIVTCARWHLRFSLSLRNVEELIAERGLFVDHTTVWRRMQAYAPEVQRRLRGQLKPKGSTWHIDETFIRISGRCGQLRPLHRAMQNAELVAKSDDLYLKCGTAANTDVNNTEKTRAGENRRKRRKTPLYQPDPNLRER